MTTPSRIVTRFAPSPTGFLHLGHAYSALFTAAKAKEEDGRFLLRIEDIDKARVRPEYEAAIFEDLAWLGLTWETPVRRQSDHFGDYRAALDELDSQGLLYPCFCSRKEIRAEIENAGQAPHGIPLGPEGPLYPGTCRSLGEGERKRRMADEPFALRLDVDAAVQKARTGPGGSGDIPGPEARTGKQQEAGRTGGSTGKQQEVRDIAGPLTWTDGDKGEVEARPKLLGDVVLARKETPASYHLSVVVDDHAQGVSLVTRGEDLFPATHVHRLLQALLGLDTPRYHHHKLLTTEDGERFAKRDKSQTIRALREAGKTPEEVRAMAGMAP